MLKKNKKPQKKVKKPINTKRFTTLLIIAAFLATAAAVVTGGYARGGYSVEVGRPSPVKFVASRDVVNTIATERLKEDARKSVTDQFTRDVAATDELTRSLEVFFETAFAYRAGRTPVYTPGVEQAPIVDVAELLDVLTAEQLDTLAALDTPTFNALRDWLKQIQEDILQSGVRPGSGEELAKTEARGMINALDLPQSVHSLAYAIIENFIEPNNVYDAEETLRRREEKAAEVEPVIHLRNQKIVDENEIITEEAYEILTSLGLVSRSFTENALPSFGALIIAIIIFVMSCLYINYFNKDIKNKTKMYTLIFTLYIITIIMAWVAAGGGFFIVPILFFTMLISMLISHRLSIFLNFSVTVVTLLIFKGDIDYLIFYLICGTAIGFLAVYTTERNKIIFVGLLSALINTGVLIGYNLFFETSVLSAEVLRNLGEELVYASLAGFLSVILATGSLPVWEALFGVITPLKLLDLTNPGNPILSKLTIEAPGTYHHSIIVANLAETAANDIGANPAIARVGGYYHDIGKIKYPQYFSENITSKNPHDTMKIRTSISVIKRHVDFGLEIAEAHKLPAVIRDIIATHHGTTLLKFFYFKIKNEHPEIPINEEDFRYDSPKPSTREAAVVMLADTAEAAIRSKSREGLKLPEIEQTVRSLIKDKLDDGQLEESGLTIKDLATITGAFMRVFKGMYHERIPYPTEKSKDETVEEVLGRA